MSRRPHPYTRSGSDHRDNKNASSKLGPMRDNDDKGLIEARTQQERLSRTLFIRNISYEVTDDEIRGLLTKHGEIKKFFNLVEKRGMAFVTFYDIRDAEKAKNALHEYKLKGRTMNAHYALPKDDGGDEEDRNTGTLYVTFKGVSQNPNFPDARKFFERWGQVREVRDCKGSPKQKFVEYYDLRDAEDALKKAQGLKYQDGVLEIKFAHPQKFDSKSASQSSSSSSASSSSSSSSQSTTTTNTLPSQLPQLDASMLNINPALLGFLPNLPSGLSLGGYTLVPNTLAQNFLPQQSNIENVSPTSVPNIPSTSLPSSIYIDPSKIDPNLFAQLAQALGPSLIQSPPGNQYQQQPSMHIPVVPQSFQTKPIVNNQIPEQYLQVNVPSNQSESSSHNVGYGQGGAAMPQITNQSANSISSLQLLNMLLQQQQNAQQSSTK